MTKLVKAVIFDVDGTLIDSVDLNAQAWVETFAHFGLAVSHDDARGQIGKGGDQLLPVFLTKDRIAREGEAIEGFRSDLFQRKFLPQVRPFPGVRSLFERLRAEGMSIALASSGKADDVAYYQKMLEITDLVDVVTTSDDAERSKPYPDIFEAALAKLAPIRASEAMVVGDTPYDAQAAQAAGLAAIGVLCGGFPAANLSAAGCAALYPDAQSLLDGFAGSPLAA